MMILSIITITYNNIAGLKRTVESVTRQQFHDWELIVVDGASNDGTLEWLAEFKRNNQAVNFHYVSEPDNGVYEAQNKGIRMTTGDYCFFLNAGDVFCDEHVLTQMFQDKPTADIVYGNEIVVDADGRRVGYCKGVENPTFLDLYQSCMKHQATFIHKSLFDKYGMYDDSLRIVADWEWFLRIIAFHDDVTLQYKNIDVTFFEAGGFSYTHPEICKAENAIVRKRYMSSKRMQADYDFFCRYERLRDAERYTILHFLLKAIMWCIKYIRRKR